MESNIKRKLSRLAGFVVAGIMSILVAEFIAISLLMLIWLLTKLIYG